MAAVGREMGLDMGHLDGRAHETKRKSAGSMDEFLRNMRAEKPIGTRSFGKEEETSRYPLEVIVSNSLRTFDPKFSLFIEFAFKSNLDD